MKYQAFLIKYGEIGVKGKNRYVFEDALVRQIRRSLSRVEGSFNVTKESGRIYAYALSDYDYDEVVEALTHVFGIIGICPVVVTEDTGFENLAKDVISFLKETHGEEPYTFKVNARRGRKNYPMNSMEINQRWDTRF